MNSINPKLTTVALVGLLFVCVRQGKSQIRDMGGATPLHTRVRVTSVSAAGDTTRLTYVVDNLSSPTSGEDLWEFLVDAPATPIRVDPPAGQWSTQKIFRGRTTAEWVNQGDSLSHPGQSTPPLSFSALGLPDLVQYWAIPNLAAHMPVDDERNYHIEPLKGFADSGTTVGIVPLVPSAPAATRLARLHALLDYSCGSAQWINDASVCAGLRSKLDSASTVLASGDVSRATGAVNGFIQELDAQHGSGLGKHVSDDAYALLRPNAVYLGRHMNA